MSRRIALTLVEVVVVLGVLALAVGVAIPLARSTVSVDARYVALYLMRERALALTAPANRPSDRQVCVLGGPEPVALAVQSILVGLPPRGVTFTSDGLPRTCDGGGVGNTTILLEHRGRQAAVIVSSLGRIRWELR